MFHLPILCHWFDCFAWNSFCACFFVFFLSFFNALQKNKTKRHQIRCDVKVMNIHDHILQVTNELHLFFPLFFVVWSVDSSRMCCQSVYNMYHFDSIYDIFQHLIIRTYTIHTFSIHCSQSLSHSLIISRYYCWSVLLLSVNSYMSRQKKLYHLHTQSFRRISFVSFDAEFVICIRPFFSRRCGHQRFLNKCSAFKSHAT